MGKRSEQFKRSGCISVNVSTVYYDNFIVGRNHDVSHGESNAFERNEINSAEKRLILFACSYFKV